MPVVMAQETAIVSRKPYAGERKERDMPDTIEIDTADYERFIAAAYAVAKPELERLVQTTIASLRDMDAVGLFGDVAARHLWDEYCWQLQEGPYDDDDFGFGSTSRNFDEVLSTVVTDALEELPKHTLLFLSIYTRNDAGDAHDPENNGGISRDDIATAVLERVTQAASRRNLDFIGPDRGDVIPMEISLGGLIGEALSHAGEKSDFLSEYVDELLAGGDDDIAHISHALLERYMELLHEDEDALLLSALRDRFEEDIRALVLEKDIRPTVENAVGELQWTLDEAS